GGKPHHQRAGQAVPGVAAGNHEAPRRAGRRRPDPAHQDRAHGRLPTDPGADGASDGVARAIRTLLDGTARPSRRLFGEGPMASKPSLTLKRRLKAPPEKVYEAWTQPAQMMRWWGGNNEA